MLQLRTIEIEREKTFQKVRWYLPIFLVLASSWVFLCYSDSQIKPSDAYVDYWKQQNPEMSLIELAKERYQLMKNYYDEHIK